jgi:hypothetical protein
MAKEEVPAPRDTVMGLVLILPLGLMGHSLKPAKLVLVAAHKDVAGNDTELVQDRTWLVRAPLVETGSYTGMEVGWPVHIPAHQVRQWARDGHAIVSPSWFMPDTP